MADWIPVPIVYTAHARDRMGERDITEAEVSEVLDRYDVRYSDGPRTVLVGPTATGRRLKVVADLRTPGNPVIITTAEPSGS